VCLCLSYASLPTFLRDVLSRRHRYSTVGASRRVSAFHVLDTSVAAYLATTVSKVVQIPFPVLSYGFGTWYLIINMLAPLRTSQNTIRSKYKTSTCFGTGVPSSGSYSEERSTVPTAV
jgi:hypothetical protein